MSHSFSELKIYGNGTSKKAALLVVGFRGKISDLEKAAQDLVNYGFDVYCYEFSPEVFTAGRPDYLPAVVREIHDDFLGHTQKYKIILPVGVSIGAGIAWSIQKDNDKRILPGIYAAAGADSADGIFNRNPITRSIKKKFINNGYTKADLQNAWKDIHQPPKASFVMVLGGLDLIVRQRSIQKEIIIWQSNGVSVKTKTMWRLSHSGTIKWFNNNIPTMLKLIEEF